MSFPPPGPPTQRALVAARLVGVWATAVVGIGALDGSGAALLPDTTIPAAPAVAVLLASAVGVGLLALVRRHPLAGWAQPLLSALTIGSLGPFVTTDPLTAGAVVAWNLVLLTRHFFPIRLPRRLPGAEPPHPWTAARRHLAAVALVLAVCVSGYRLADGPAALAACWLPGLLALGAGPGFLPRHPLGALPLLPVLAGLVALATGHPTLSIALLGVSQLLLLVTLAAQNRAAGELLRSFLAHPSRLVALSFATLVAAGTVVLTFPAAVPAGAPALDGLEALFTATSASCVTGLIVLDTPNDFSRFGQVVLLLLMQTGGLGIMVLSTFAMLLLGTRLGLRGEGALSEVLETPDHPAAARLARFVVLTTLAIEAVGAAVLAGLLVRRGTEPAEAVWLGVFHAVSAFCNAGFALWSDSLVSFRGDPAVLLVFALLIVLGGVGFSVLASLGGRMLRRDRPADRLPTQARVVVGMTAVLLAAGALLFGVLERETTLAGLGPLDRAVNALFQSATLRTAGFNSVDFGALAPATLAPVLLLMFVGASPGSTGGGVRTTTVAVLFAAVRSMILGRRATTLLDREVPDEIVRRAVAVVFVSGLVVSVGFTLLLHFEAQPFEALLFEAVSAYGTVGLSTGITPHLGPAGRLVLVVLMFAGRTGPLTLVLLLASRHPGEAAIRRPATRIMVG